jgi:general secretion pathway protein D
MRKSLGYQVAIEARFLVVGENFLEDIGLDLDFRFMIDDNIIDVQQGSAEMTEPQSTGVRGSLGPTVDTPIIGAEVQGGFGNMAPPILDDLEVTFLLRAVQGHRDSKSLNAPKVTVLSGESAVMRVQRTIRFPLVPNVGTSATALGVGGGTTSTNLQQNYGEILTGTVLSITPSITPDKKHVLLNIITELRDFLGFETTNVSIPNLATPTATAGGVADPNLSQTISYPVTLPQTEISRVQTRVNVPDRGTLLLGGQKVTVEIETEAGVPVLSKIPLVGRLFSNRSKIKDHKILLILVKPTIILQEEKDAEAIAGMENVF